MLLFYNFQFSLLHAEPKVTSARWTLYYNDIGNFEGHFSLSSNLFDIVAKNRYLVVCDGDKSAIIIGYELNDELVLYGRTTNWLLTKRIIAPQTKVTANAAVLCRNMVKNAFSDVTNFALDDRTLGYAVDFEKNSQGTLFDAVRECLSLNKLGHRLKFDYKNKRWLFEILCGRQLDLIISESNKNATDTKLEYDILDYATCGWYYNETSEESVRTLYNPNSSYGIYRWESELGASSETEAKAELDKMRENNAITLKTRGMVRGTDYDLGDILRVQVTKNNFRTTRKMRVTGTETRIGEISEETPILKEE